MSTARKQGNTCLATSNGHRVEPCTTSLYTSAFSSTLLPASARYLWGAGSLPAELCDCPTRSDCVVMRIPNPRHYSRNFHKISLILQIILENKYLSV